MSKNTELKNFQNTLESWRSSTKEITENKQDLKKLVSIKIGQDWSKVLRSLELKKNQLVELRQSVMLEAANNVINIIKILAPKKTGNYANTWRIREVGPNRISIAPDNEKLALFLEYGTAPHDIEPRFKSVLHWVDESGEDRFATIVHHPGTPAFPHIRPAMEQLKEDLKQIVLRQLKERKIIE